MFLNITIFVASLCVPERNIVKCQLCDWGFNIIYELLYRRVGLTILLIKHVHVKIEACITWQRYYDSSIQTWACRSKVTMEKQKLSRKYCSWSRSKAPPTRKAIMLGFWMSTEVQRTCTTPRHMMQTNRTWSTRKEVQ